MHSASTIFLITILSMVVASSATVCVVSEWSDCDAYQTRTRQCDGVVSIEARDCAPPPNPIAPFIVGDISSDHAATIYGSRVRPCNELEFDSSCATDSASCIARCKPVSGSCVDGVDCVAGVLFSDCTVLVDCTGRGVYRSDNFKTLVRSLTEDETAASCGPGWITDPDRETCVSIGCRRGTEECECQQCHCPNRQKDALGRCLELTGLVSSTTFAAKVGSMDAVQQVCGSRATGAVYDCGPDGASCVVSPSACECQENAYDPVFAYHGKPCAGSKAVCTLAELATCGSATRGCARVYDRQSHPSGPVRNATIAPGEYTICACGSEHVVVTPPLITDGEVLPHRATHGGLLPSVEDVHLAMEIELTRRARWAGDVRYPHATVADHGVCTSSPAPLIILRPLEEHCVIEGAFHDPKIVPTAVIVGDVVVCVCPPIVSFYALAPDGIVRCVPTPFQDGRLNTRRRIHRAGPNGEEVCSYDTGCTPVVDIPDVSCTLLEAYRECGPGFNATTDTCTRSSTDQFTCNCESDPVLVSIVDPIHKRKCMNHASFRLPCTAHDTMRLCHATPIDSDYAAAPFVLAGGLVVNVNAAGYDQELCAFNPFRAPEASVDLSSCPGMREIRRCTEEESESFCRGSTCMASCDGDECRLWGVCGYTEPCRPIDVEKVCSGNGDGTDSNGCARSYFQTRHGMTSEIVATPEACTCKEGFRGARCENHISDGDACSDEETVVACGVGALSCTLHGLKPRCTCVEGAGLTNVRVDREYVYSETFGMRLTYDHYTTRARNCSGFVRPCTTDETTEYGGKHALSCRVSCPGTDDGTDCRIHEWVCDPEVHGLIEYTTFPARFASLDRLDVRPCDFPAGSPNDTIGIFDVNSVGVLSTQSVKRVSPSRRILQALAVPLDVELQDDQTLWRLVCGDGVESAVVVATPSGSSVSPSSCRCLPGWVRQNLGGGASRPCGLQGSVVSCNDAETTWYTNYGYGLIFGSVCKILVSGSARYIYSEPPAPLLGTAITASIPFPLIRQVCGTDTQDTRTRFTCTYPDTPLTLPICQIDSTKCRCQPFLNAQVDGIGRPCGRNYNVRNIADVTPPRAISNVCPGSGAYGALMRCDEVACNILHACQCIDPVASAAFAITRAGVNYGDLPVSGLSGAQIVAGSAGTGYFSRCECGQVGSPCHSRATQCEAKRRCGVFATAMRARCFIDGSCTNADIGCECAPGTGLFGPTLCGGYESPCTATEVATHCASSFVASANNAIYQRFPTSCTMLRTPFGDSAFKANSCGGMRDNIRECATTQEKVASCGIGATACRWHSVLNKPLPIAIRECVCGQGYFWDNERQRCTSVNLGTRACTQEEAAFCVGTESSSSNFCRVRTFAVPTSYVFDDGTVATAAGLRTISRLLWEYQTGVPSDGGHSVFTPYQLQYMASTPKRIGLRECRCVSSRGSFFGNTANLTDIRDIPVSTGTTASDAWQSELGLFVRFYDANPTHTGLAQPVLQLVCPGYSKLDTFYQSFFSGHCPTGVNGQACSGRGQCLSLQQTDITAIVAAMRIEAVRFVATFPAYVNNATTAGQVPSYEGHAVFEHRANLEFLYRNAHELPGSIVKWIEILPGFDAFPQPYRRLGLVTRPTEFDPTTGSDMVFDGVALRSFEIDCSIVNDTRTNQIYHDLMIRRLVVNGLRIMDTNHGEIIVNPGLYRRQILAKPMYGYGVYPGDILSADDRITKTHKGKLVHGDHCWDRVFRSTGANRGAGVDFSSPCLATWPKAPVVRSGGLTYLDNRPTDWYRYQHVGTGRRDARLDYDTQCSEVTSLECQHQLMVKGSVEFAKGAVNARSGLFCISRDGGLSNSQIGLMRRAKMRCESYDLGADNLQGYGEVREWRESKLNWQEQFRGKNTINVEMNPELDCTNKPVAYCNLTYIWGCTVYFDFSGFAPSVAPGTTPGTGTDTTYRDTSSVGKVHCGPWVESGYNYVCPRRPFPTTPYGYNEFGISLGVCPDRAGGANDLIIRMTYDAADPRYVMPETCARCDPGPSPAPERDERKCRTKADTSEHNLFWVFREFGPRCVDQETVVQHAGTACDRCPNTATRSNAQTGRSMWTNNPWNLDRKMYTPINYRAPLHLETASATYENALNEGTFERISESKLSWYPSSLDADDAAVTDPVLRAGSFLGRGMFRTFRARLQDGEHIIPSLMAYYPDVLENGVADPANGLDIARIHPLYLQLFGRSGDKTRTYSMFPYSKDPEFDIRVEHPDGTYISPADYEWSQTSPFGYVMATVYNWTAGNIATQTAEQVKSVSYDHWRKNVRQSGKPTRCVITGEIGTESIIPSSSGHALATYAQCACAPGFLSRTPPVSRDVYPTGHYSYAWGTTIDTSGAYADRSACEFRDSATYPFYAVYCDRSVLPGTEPVADFAGSYCRPVPNADEVGRAYCVHGQWDVLFARCACDAGWTYDRFDEPQLAKCTAEQGSCPGTVCHQTSGRLNNATCTCDCTPGWGGRLCDIDLRAPLSPCITVIEGSTFNTVCCKGVGTISSYPTHVCTCASGTRGRWDATTNCGTVVVTDTVFRDACVSNGGTVSVRPECAPSTFNAEKCATSAFLQCVCPAHRYGERCEISMCPSDANGAVCGGPSRGSCSVVAGVPTCTCAPSCELVDPVTPACALAQANFINGTSRTGFPRWGGCACDVNLRERCSPPLDPVLCHSAQHGANRCRPLLNVTSMITNYACDCSTGGDGSERGTYCEQSACPLAPNGLVCNGRACQVDAHRVGTCDCTPTFSSSALLVGPACELNATVACGVAHPIFGTLSECGGNGECICPTGAGSCACVCGAAYDVNTKCATSRCTVPCVFGTCTLSGGGATCVCNRAYARNSTGSCTVNACLYGASPSEDGHRCICADPLMGYGHNCQAPDCPVDADGNMCGEPHTHDFKLTGTLVDYRFKECLTSGICSCGVGYVFNNGTGLCDWFCDPEGTSSSILDSFEKTVACACSVGSIGARCKARQCDPNSIPNSDGVSCTCRPPQVATGPRSCALPPCVNGVISPGQVPCICHNGWQGAACDVPLCGNGGYWDADTERCVCVFPFTVASFCQQAYCGPTSSWDGHACVCNPGYRGQGCGERICGVGSEHPLGDLTSCICQPAYTGPDCSAPLCGNGAAVCARDSCTCFCNIGWALNANQTSCSVNQCGLHGTAVTSAPVNGIICTCNNGFAYDPTSHYGVLCVRPCSTMHTVSYSATTGVCTCAVGWVGPTCDVSITVGGGTGTGSGGGSGSTGATGGGGGTVDGDGDPVTETPTESSSALSTVQIVAIVGGIAVAIVFAFVMSRVFVVGAPSASMVPTQRG